MTTSTDHGCRFAADGTERHFGDSTARFPYWSFTKTVIAVAALKLHDEGGLDLDSRLPAQPFTMRQLLGHRAGLRDYGQLPEYHEAVLAEQAPWSRNTMLEKSLSRGPLFAPDAGWSYSNIGYMMAAERLSEVSGDRLGPLIGRLVLRPLGVTGIRLATGRDDFRHLHWPAAARYDPGWVYHGCLIGTAADAARLLHGLMAGDLLRPDSLAQMLAMHHLGGALPSRPWTRHGYGLGLMIGEMGSAGRAIGHSGGGPFCVNAVYHFPDLAAPVTVACFSNGTDEGRVESLAAGIAIAA